VALLVASIAYWIGNPLLNPAVIVFLLLVLPWPYALVRAAVGIVQVVGVGPLVARLVDRGEPGAGVVDAIAAGGPAVTVPELSRIPGDFLRSLLVVLGSLLAGGLTLALTS
jgi:uncharacterized membrane protein YraQ (UPF0718 family)